MWTLTSFTAPVVSVLALYSRRAPLLFVTSRPLVTTGDPKALSHVDRVPVWLVGEVFF